MERGGITQGVLELQQPQNVFSLKFKMAELKTIQETEEVAPSCGLCHGPLRMPRVLPCLDIFCLECLERHFEGKKDGQTASMGKPEQTTKQTNQSKDAKQDTSANSQSKIANQDGTSQSKDAKPETAANGQSKLARQGKEDGASQSRDVKQREAVTGKQKCPICEEEFKMPVGGVRRLSLAAHMQSLSDILNVEEEGVCQFCSAEQKKAETYCLDCSLAMCQQCRKLHSRVSGTARHNLIPLDHRPQDDGMANVISDVSSVLQKRHMECSRHDHQPVMYCCVTCDALLCVSCKIEEHAEHIVEPLDKAACNRRESLLDIMTLLQDHKKTTRGSVRTARDYLAEIRREFARAERHVDKLAQRLVDEINHEKQKVLHQITLRRDKEESIVSKRVQKLEKAQAQVTNATYYTQSVLSFASDAEVLRVSRLIVDRYRVIRRQEDLLLNRRLRVKVTKPPKPPATLLPEIDFGVRLEEVYPELQAPVIVSTLKAEGSITGLVPMADDKIAVVNFCTQKFCIYKRNGKLVTELNDGLTQPVSATVTSSEQIYVTDMGDANKVGMGIRTVSANGKLQPGQVTLPMKPWGVAVTRKGEFVVCHPDRHTVCIYHANGKVKHTLKSSNPSQRLFNNPRCVTVNHDDTIIVSDFANHNVLLFDPEGNLKVTYGSEGGGKEQLRHPCGVCCDRYGHIIIADSNNHRLHVLSSRGELRGYLAGGEGGVVEPVAVAVTHSGELLVGEWEGQVHVVRYL